MIAPRTGPRAASARRATCIVLAVAALGGCRPSGTTRPVEKLNVILVSVDTTRADHLHCYGRKEARTPHIDRLAAEGTRFEQCISSVPETLPSHATMLTGCYPFVHGVRANGASELGTRNRSLPEILREAGYASAAEVSAPVLNEAYGLSQGFKDYGDVMTRYADIAGRLAKTPDGEVAEPGMKLPAASSSAPSAEPPPLVFRTRVAEDITRHGIEWLNALRGQPFFLFLHYFDPHLPYEAPEPFASQNADGYLAEIAYFDSQFGRLMDEVRRLGMADRTLVILTSDHGEGLGQHGEETHSFFCYDTTVHVPLILWSPGRVPAGQVVESQVRHIDIVPTVLDFIGLKAPSAVQGASLRPLLDNPRLDLHLPCYGEAGAGHEFLDYALLRFLRQDGWKYIHAPRPELYHVADDPDELINLSMQQPQRVADMRAALRALIADSPPPPHGRRTRKSVSAADAAVMAKLGYLVDESSAASQSAEDARSELDEFDPVGENPRDRLEVVSLLAAAMGALVSGDCQSAEGHYRRLLEIEPDNFRALKELGDALLCQKRLDDALEFYRRARDVNPKHGNVLTAIAWLQSMRGETGEAEKQFRAAIEAAPTNGTAHHGMANLLAQSGRYDEAFQHYELAARYAGNNAEVFFSWGLALRLAGKLEDAETRFREGLRLDAKNMPARATLALVLRDLKKPAEAVREMRMVFEAVPRDVSVIRRLAAWLTEDGDVDGAAKLYAAAAELDPTVPQAQFNLGLALSMAGRHEDAIAALRKALELNPAYVRAQAELANSLELTGRRDEALAAYRKLVTLDPTQTQAYQAVADLLATRGEFKEAADALRQGLAANPDHPVLCNDLAWRLATTPLAAGGDGAEAVRLAEKANVAANSGSPAVLDTLAAAYAAAGRFDDAVRTADQAIELAARGDDEAFVAKVRARRALYADRKPYVAK